MDLCINSILVAASDRNPDTANISLRLKGAEAVRYWKLMDSAKARNPYIALSDVIRELLGLDPPSLITKAELEYFRNASRVEAQHGTKVAPNSSQPIPHFEEKLGKRKNKAG